MRGSFNFSVDTASLNDFSARCEATITKVGNGSRKALIAALDEILEDSLMQVPMKTGALMQSGSYEVTGDYKAGWEGRVGYCLSIDAINPTTGTPVSSYALAVHENLSAVHPIGKAKFLEDPVRAYAKRRFPRTVFKYVQDSLAD